jgi:hypothetical protein
MNELRILCVGKIVDGPIEWNPPLPPEPEPDGTLQDIMDIANADMLAEEYEDYFLDQAWMNGGLS